MQIAKLKQPEVVIDAEQNSPCSDKLHTLVCMHVAECQQQKPCVFFLPLFIQIIQNKDHALLQLHSESNSKNVFNFNLIKIG